MWASKSHSGVGTKGGGRDLCSFLKCFLFLFMLFLCNIAMLLKEQSRSFKNQDHANIINYIDKNIEARVRVPRLPRARYRVTFQEGYIQSNVQ